jgi:methyl-accepting chemotaxis protein
MNIFSNMKVGTKISAGYGVILTLMAVVSLVVYFGIASMLDASRWVNHTYEVIRKAEAVGASMIDMETGQRGFMITGEDEYLEPFNNGIKVFERMIAEGQQLTSDNLVQGKRWKEVDDLQAQWLIEVAEPEIAARREVTQGADAVANFKTVSSRLVGKQLFDSIRGMLANLETKFTQQNNPKGQQLVTLITLDLVNMETGQRGYLLSGQDISLEPFNQGKQNLSLHLDQVRNLLQGGSVKRVDIDALEKKIGDWVRLAAQPEIDARRDMNGYPLTIDDVTTMMRTGKGKFYMDTIRVVLKNIVDAEEVLIKVRGDQQSSTYIFSKTFSFLGTLITLVFGILVAKFISNSITRPLRLIVTRAKEITSGDLTGIKIQPKGNDELAELTNAMNEMHESLHDIIHLVSDSAGEMSSAATQLQSSALQTNQGMESQQSETQQVATAMNEMSATVQEVSRHASQAATSASEADKASAHGYNLVSQNMNGINKLALSIGTTSKAINKLGEDTNSVDNIVAVISEIADQTNLLALNAAIEAARAGEQGRGFAVVADEVRTLASRTQKSTEEIRTMLDQLKTGAKGAVQAMDEGQGQAQSSVEQAKNASDAITEITRVVTEISEMNSLIATAAKEQHIVTEEMNRNVVNVNSESHLILQHSRETSAAAEQIGVLSSQMQQVVSRFRI